LIVVKHFYSLVFIIAKEVIARAAIAMLLSPFFVGVGLPAIALVPECAKKD
jgi:hypothetical protein